MWSLPSRFISMECQFWLIAIILGLLLKAKEKETDVGKQRPINATKEKNSDENVRQRPNLLPPYGD